MGDIDLSKRNPLAPWIEPSDTEEDASAKPVEEAASEKKPLPLKLHPLQRIDLSKALKK